MSSKKFVSVSFNKLFERKDNNLLDAVAFAVGANRDINQQLIKWFNNSQSITSQNLEAYYSNGSKGINLLPKEVIQTSKIVADINANKQNVANFAGVSPDDLRDFSLFRSGADTPDEIAEARLTTEFTYIPFLKSIDVVKLINLPTGYSGFVFWRHQTILNNSNVNDYIHEVIGFSSGVDIPGFDDDGNIERERSSMSVSVKSTRISDGFITNSIFRVPTDYYDKNNQLNTVTIDTASFEYQGNFVQLNFLEENSILSFSVSNPTNSSSGSWFNSTPQGGESPYDFYPWLPVISNGKKVNSKNFGSDIYTRIKQTSDSINLPFESIVDAVPLIPGEDTTTNDAFIFPAIDLCTKNVHALQYLFDYFMDYYPSLLTDKPLPRSISLLPRTPNGETSFNLYYLRFNFTSIEINTFQGNLPSSNRAGGFNIDFDKRSETDEDDDKSRVVEWNYYLSKQNNNNTYTTIKLTRPSYYTYVVRQRGKTASWEEIEDALNNDSDQCNLRMPIIRERMLAYPANIQSEIAIEAFGLEVGTFTNIDVPWYASGFFSFVLNILAVASVIFTIFTLGASSSLTALLLSLVQLAAVNFVIQILIEELGIGGAFAVIIAVAIGRAGGIAEFGNYLKSALKSAQLLVELTNSLVNIANIYREVQAEQLADEAEDFFNGIAAAQKKIEDYYASAEGALEELNPYYEGLATKDMIVIESPTDFYFRTIHAGNIGAESLQYPTTFVSEALSLESESLEETDFIIV